MIRFIDIVLSFLGLVVLLPLLVLIFILGLFDTGKPLLFQPRVGKYKKIFTLVKFRTMKMSTKSLPSHLVGRENVTKFGRLLRKFKLDELPQLWNVIKGDMSIVGPRPIIAQEVKVIENRFKHGVSNVCPGITGLAQIKRIGTESPDYQLELELKMLENFNIKRYFYFIIKTILGKGRGDCIKSSNQKNI